MKEFLENDTDLHKKTRIPPNSLLGITEFLLTRTLFRFTEKFLTQTDGVAMGGPASSVVAELYMQHHDQRALIATFKTALKYYERFVDDTFVL